MDIESTDTLEPDDHRRLFLEGIRMGMDYSEASLFAGVNRATSYRWRQDPEFQKQVDAAREVCIENLIKEAERRAMRGSDKLLEFLLCNYAPDKFKRTQSVEMNAKVQSRAEVKIVTEFDANDASDLV